MKYDFDEVIAREGTDAEKLDRCMDIFGHADVIPMWVADMDFATPLPIMNAIKRRAEHPILGYTHRSAGFFGSIINWVGKRNGWNIENEWIDFTPGVVPGLVFAIRAFTREGDGIVIQPPVYHPFAGQINRNGRVVVNNPLRYTDGRYEIDFEDLDHKLRGAKVFMMCNPHNPSGRVFTREELTRIGKLCVKHDVLIFADEIHSDLVYSPNRHVHIASLSDEFAARTLTFIAPSKTFNVAGLSTSVVITPDEGLRCRLRTEFDRMHADQGNIFGSVALEAAYSECEDWLEQLLEYLKGNVDYVTDFLARELPSVTCVKTEGTYLMWLNFSQWGMTHKEIFRFICDRAGIGVNEGTMFGRKEGEYWMRFNVATRREVVQRAMKQLTDAYNEYSGGR